MKKSLSSLLLSLLLVFSILPSSFVSADSSQMLSFNNKITGSITGTGKELDQYSFIVPSAGRVNLEVFSEINEALFYVMASDGTTELAKKDLYFGSEAEPKKWDTWLDLEAGTYYIKVKQYRDHTGTYSLKLTHTAANNQDNEPNDSAESAQLLNLKGTVQKGFISASDSIDVYRMDVPSAGQVDFEVLSYINEVLLYILDDDGTTEIVKKDLFFGNPDEPKKWTGSLDLEAGTYYFKVKKYGKDTGAYTVKASHTPAKGNDAEPNNNTERAQVLQANSKALTGYISESDEIDVYRFHMPKAGQVDLEVFSQINEVLVYLLDTDGTSEINKADLFFGSAKEPKKWNGSFDLEAGTYYVKIKKYSSYTGKYTLKVNYKAYNGNDAESNDTKEKAQPIKLTNQLMKGWISWSDDVDMYKLTVPKAGPVKLDFTSQINEVLIYLLASDGVTELYKNDIYFASDADPKKVTQKFQLKPGTYYVKVKKYGSHTGAYSLRMRELTPPAAPKVNTLTSKSTKVTGKAEASSTVTVYSGKTLLGKATANKSGNFSVAIKAQKAKKSITVYATDAAGNRSAPTKVIVK
ncbi:Ig-like domain-containing protein [Paenibacillus dakarensis]|uniref:Ig-like domain-containing protein n=1 Tax=Paenibacillus dakarensis TaxID=1527293 RepID=UPI000ABD532E|nr:Ig-like domain-containing protein [Paenibacillus dakarensis]